MDAAPASLAAFSLFGLDAVWWATLLTAVGTIAVLIAAYTAATVRDPMARRVKALNDRREQLKAGITASTTRRRTSLVQKNETADRMRAVLARLKVLQHKQLVEIQQKIIQAGIRTKDAGIVVIFARLVLPLIVGPLAVYFVYFSSMFASSGALTKFGVFAAALIGSYKAADLYVENRRQKRTAALRKGLPDALDLLVICAEAGLTVDAAFNRVARELGRGYPELAEEFGLTAIELGFLNERRQAFDNLAYRVNLDAIKGVTTTLIQTEKYGTPLASSLRVLSAEFRHDRMMRAEEKAARLPAIMTVPLILFILPTLFVVILGPAACSISDMINSGAFGGK